MKVAAFTGSRTIGSPRFRVRQYIPKLREQGIEVTEYVARFGSWPPLNKALRPIWFPATILDRIPAILKSYRHDVTLLQREMISTLVTLERFTSRPRLLDVDDAVWLHKGRETNFKAIARMCDGVICGNTFLEESIKGWQPETMVLPTAVDTERFCPAVGANGGSRPIIGWSGMSSGLQYLTEIEIALARLLQEHPQSVLRIVCERPPNFSTLDASRVEYIPWSAENEARTIQEMTVGLMPIDDSLFSRGKCSYKMLLYMSCGVPVVVSPIGMNKEVLALGNVGFGAARDSEWYDALSWLLKNPEEGREMGTEGRRIVEENYSLHVLAPRLASYIRKFGKYSSN
jgi:glycosyltransferase involved in cell wall biosynthesis